MPDASFIDADVDYYVLLNLDPSSAIEPSALRKAYRRASLLYHPDKNPSPDAAQKFHLLTLAYDILSDGKTKDAYDNARAARLARKRRLEVENEGRRKMREELEAREKGWKKARMEEREAEKVFQERLEKLREEGVRLRMRREEALRKAEEEEDREKEKEKMDKGTEQEKEVKKSVFTELDRTVKVRWKRRTDSLFTKESIQKLFSKFGTVQDCVLLPGKPDKDGKLKKLKTALIVYDNVYSAYSAVHDSRPEEEFKEFKNVSWAGGKKPDVGSLGLGVEVTKEKDERANKKCETVAAGLASLENDTPPWFSTPSSTATLATKKPPAFSFSSSSFGGKPEETSGATQVLSSADYESITLLRMRQAEKRRLEEEIRMMEAEEDGKEKVKEKIAL